MASEPDDAIHFSNFCEKGADHTLDAHPKRTMASTLAEIPVDSPRKRDKATIPDAAE